MHDNLIGRATQLSTRPRTTFILGGARSGKSLHAERLAHASGVPVTYIATASRPLDDVAFAERIALHRARRPVAWELIESGPNLADVLMRADRPDGLILLDCLTLWLTQLLCPIDGGPPCADWPERLNAFDRALAETRGQVIIVSNEIGMGVVPMGALTRLYVDELGRLNQRVAAACDSVLLTVAGLPLVVK